MTRRLNGLNFSNMNLGKFGTWLYYQRHGTCGEIATSQDELRLFYFIFLKHSRGILKINKQINIYWLNCGHICIIDVTDECVRVSSCRLQKKTVTECFTIFRFEKWPALQRRSWRMRWWTTGSPFLQPTPGLHLSCSISIYRWLRQRPHPNR